MLNSLDITSDDPEELRSVNRLLADEVKALSLKVEQLQHQLHGHNRHRFGSKSESFDQLNLTFAEDEEISKAAAAQTEAATEPDEDQKSRRQHSRKPLPDHLNRHDEVLSPGDDCGRCGGHLKTLGERRTGICARSVCCKSHHTTPQSLHVLRSHRAIATAVAPD